MMSQAIEGTWIRMGSYGQLMAEWVIKTIMSVTNHKCDISISLIFDTVIQCLTVFLTVLWYWVLPNVPLMKNSLNSPHITFLVISK